MVIIKLKVNNSNSVFKSEELYESDAVLAMLKAVGKNKFKILEISGQIPPIQKEEKSYLERVNEVKMSKL